MGKSFEPYTDENGVAWYPMTFGNYDVHHLTGELSLREDLNCERPICDDWDKLLKMLSFKKPCASEFRDHMFWSSNKQE